MKIVELSTELASLATMMYLVIVKHYGSQAAMDADVAQMKKLMGTDETALFFQLTARMKLFYAEFMPLVQRFTLITAEIARLSK